MNPPKAKEVRIPSEPSEDKRVLVKCIFCKESVVKDEHKNCPKRKAPAVQFKGIAFSRYKRNWQ